MAAHKKETVSIHYSTHVVSAENKLPAIIEAISFLQEKRNRPVTVQEISNHLGVKKSTLHAYLFLLRNYSKMVLGFNQEKNPSRRSQNVFWVGEKPIGDSIEQKQESTQELTVADIVSNLDSVQPEQEFVMANIPAENNINQLPPMTGYSSPIEFGQYLVRLGAYYTNQGLAILQRNSF